MNKKEVAKELRKLLTEAIRNLPDAEYVNVTKFEDETRRRGQFCLPDQFTYHHGHLYQIELIVEQEIGTEQEETKK